MRNLAAALLMTMALGACGQESPPTPPPPPTSAFPDLAQGSYRLEANISQDGRSAPIIMIRDGKKMRVELVTGEGPSTIINDGESGETHVIITIGGRQMAVRGNTAAANIDPAANWSADIAANATRTGVCEVGGETGGEWTQNGAAKTLCVTQDGIILRATESGITTWETTSLLRGPQGAENFAPPPGSRR